jgi:hypothetical protein
MRKRHVYAGGLAALVLTGVALAAVVSGSHAAPRVAAAAIQRTFVSTSGNDANPCTRTDPCRNFAAALANTLAGGEVVALDSGGYGVVTIAKAVTIAGAPGAHVAITAFSGDAVTVNAGGSDTVVLRNLYLTGLGAEAGVVFDAGGSLHLESVVATGFATGLFAPADTAALFVVDSQFRHSADTGVYIDGPRTEIEHTRADANANVGFVFTGGTVASVRRSAATHNAAHGFAMSAATVAIEDSLADGNGDYGVRIDSGATANLTGDVLSSNGLGGLTTVNASAVGRIGGSTVTRNGTGLLQAAGTLESYGDNLVRGNTTDTAGAITVVGKT